MKQKSLCLLSFFIFLSIGSFSFGMWPGNCGAGNSEGEATCEGESYEEGDQNCGERRVAADLERIETEPIQHDIRGNPEVDNTYNIDGRSYCYIGRAWSFYKFQLRSNGNEEVYLFRNGPTWEKAHLTEAWERNAQACATNREYESGTYAPRRSLRVKINNLKTYGKRHPLKVSGSLLVIGLVAYWLWEKDHSSQRRVRG